MSMTPGNWRKKGAAAMMLVPFFATGCVGPADVVVHEPGVYKGPPDPLLARQLDPDQIEALKNRFIIGQSDR